MALEYTLSTDIMSINSITNTIIDNFKIGNSKINKNDKLVNLNYDETLGFTISIIEHMKRVEYDSFSFISYTYIIFKIEKNKYYENSIELKKNIVKILLLFLPNDNNLLFTFNGENLLLVKEKNMKIIINRHYGFWDNKKLYDMIKEISDEEVSDDKEIDYYSINC